MRVLWVSLVLVVVDQLTKAWVQAAMVPGESVPLVGTLLRLTYTTNPGMAFGMTLGSKLFLTLFSVAATALIGGYLWVVRRGPVGYRLALALILGGAAGNIIDRTFYGVIGGTAPLFYGEVVDFIHVDLWRGYLPEWIPLFGGTFLSLFPIWNVADMAIVVGVAAIILFQRRFHEGLTRSAEDVPPVAEPPLAEPPRVGPPVAHPEPVSEPVGRGVAPGGEPKPASPEA